MATKRKKRSNANNKASSNGTNGTSTSVKVKKSNGSKELEPEDKKNKVEEITTTTTKTTEDGETETEKEIKLARAEKKKLKDRRRTFFIFGTVLGCVLALFLGHKTKAVALPNSLFDFEFDNIINFDNFQDVLDSWKPHLSKLLPKNLIYKSEEDLTANFALGKQLQKEFNLSAKHPVVMIPGVITTGLESWGLYGDEECDSEPHFRKRLWGSYYMLKTMLFSKNCWLKHLKLDPITGLDPPNFKLRAAQGFEATDFFVAGYWIWNKVLQNLGTLGYDPNKMVTASYDWRLAYLDLEKRDRFFTKLKEQVELGYSISGGEKSVLFSHSMGSQVAFYFLKWVEATGESYGNGGDQWCNTYVEAWVDISGSILGAPKAVPSLISGEMKDTVQLNELAVYGLESFFSRRERLDLLRSFGGIPSMLPKGGDLIWGSIASSLEDEINDISILNYHEDDNSENTNTTTSTSNNKKLRLIDIPPPNSYGEFIKFSDSTTSFSMTDSINFIIENAPFWLRNRINEQYSFGYSMSEETLVENSKNHKYWTNPLEVSLPNAPDMKIFSIYGVGNPAERSYIYKHENYQESGLNFTIDYDAQPAPVFLSDGDGTLPLITHTMSHKWRQGVSPYNPAGINVTIIELKHEPTKYDMRGGAKTAEHVDILGSAELNEYLLKIAAGKGHLINDKIITNLERWTREIAFPL